MKQNKLVIEIPKNEMPIATGVVLFHPGLLTEKKELFLIVAVIEATTAILRIFEHEDMNPELKKKCCALQNPVSYTQENLKGSAPLFADISRLIIKKTTNLLTGQYTMIVIGKVNESDLQAIQNAVLKANTVPQNIKAIYFQK